MTDRLLVLNALETVRRERNSAIVDVIERHIPVGEIRSSLYYCCIMSHRLTYPLNLNLSEHVINDEWFETVSDYIKDTSNGIECINIPYYHSEDWKRLNV